MRRISISYGQKLSVTLNKSDHDFILQNTLIEPEAFGYGVLRENKITFQLSLSDIEYIQEFIAAEANHSENKKVVKSLELIYDFFQDYFEKYKEEEQS